MEGMRVNSVKETPEKELRDRSLQPGPLAHLHWSCPARRAFSELSPAGWPADMVAEEVGLGSGCPQTGFDFDISSIVGICLGNSGPGWKPFNCDVPWYLPGLRT